MNCKTSQIKQKNILKKNPNFSIKQVLAKLAPSPPCSPFSCFLTRSFEGIPANLHSQAIAEMCVHSQYPLLWKRPFHKEQRC